MKPGPSLRTALIVLGIGVLIAVPAGILLGVRAFKAINAPSTATPGTMTRQLGNGTWYLFERTGSTSGGDGLTSNHNNNPPTLDPSQVTVTAPDGTTLPVAAVDANETITKGSRIFTAALQFHVSTPGMYAIQVDSSGPSEVLVSRPLGQTFAALVLPFSLGAVGGLLILSAIVLLIVGSSRRSRAARPLAFAPSGTPPGWYPDPQQPGAQRWWDGRTWTDHRS